MRCVQGTSFARLPANGPIDDEGRSSFKGVPTVPPRVPNWPLLQAIRAYSSANQDHKNNEADDQKKQEHNEQEPLEEERARLEEERARLEEERARLEKERARLEEEHSRLEKERSRLEKERGKMEDTAQKDKKSRIDGTIDDLLSRAEKVLHIPGRLIDLKGNIVEVITILLAMLLAMNKHFTKLLNEPRDDDEPPEPPFDIFG